MRALSLARIAAEAEGVRLRRSASRNAIRAGLGLVALLWLLAALVFVHIAIWNWLRASIGWSPLGTAWIMALGDAVIAAVLCLVAARLRPGMVELEAQAVRTRAVDGATNSLAMPVTLAQTARVGIDLLTRRRESR